jgi:hypothetical protein
LFGKLFGRKHSGEERDPFEPRMPEVDVPSSLEEVFSQARQAAAGEPPALEGGARRHIVLVTPGRMLMMVPCPSPETMPPQQVAAVENIISPRTPRNIAVIAFTELAAVRADIIRAIPFAGLLMGFVAIGHAVWVFEGHVSALAAGCREADLLIVDGGMAPHLDPGWAGIAAGSLRRPEIYVHDRAAFALRRVKVNG